jgi:hypothetical protein
MLTKSTRAPLTAIAALILGLAALLAVSATATAGSSYRGVPQRGAPLTEVRC